MKQIIILLLTAAIGSAVQAGNSTGTSLFMKEDSSVYQPGDFVKLRDEGSEILLISKSTAKISTKVISARTREPEINTIEKFMRYFDSNAGSAR